MAGPDDRAYSRSQVAAPPRKSPPRQRNVSPDDRSFSRSPKLEARPLQPKAPPVPILQNYGFHGSIQDFSTKLRIAHDAHVNHFGYAPSPGLAFDLARWDQPVDFTHLFGMPRTKRAGDARQAAIGLELPKGKPLPGDEGGDDLLMQDYLAQVSAGKADPTQHSLTKEPPDPRVVHLLETRPDFRAKAVRAQAFQQDKIIQASLGDFPVKATGFFLRGALQVVGGMVVGPPVLAYKEGVGAHQAIKQHSLTPLGKTQVDLGKAVGKGIWTDVTNPRENWGFLALDLLGFGAVLRGGGARVYRGATAPKGGKLRNLVKKPQGGMIEYRSGKHVEHETGSENMLLNDGQRLKAWWLNRKLAQRHAKGEGPILANQPQGLLSVMTPRWLADQLDAAMDHLIREPFSAEKKMGRLAQVRRRAERAIEEAPIRELEFVDGAAPLSQRLSIVHRRVKGLTVGEQKALQVRFSDLAGDDLAKLEQWRHFHEAMIDQAPEVAGRLGFDAGHIPQFLEEHRAQLQALDLAKKVFERKPSARMVKAEALTRELEAEAFRRKIGEFGLDNQAGVSRIAGAGEVVRRQREFDRDLENLPADKVAPDSIYTKFENRAKGRKQTKLEQRLTAGPRVGQWWMPPQDLKRLMPGLDTAFTGKALIKGDFRIDTTRMTAEDVAATFRAGAKIREWRELLKGSTEHPTGSGYDIPIAKVEAKGIPAGLKKVMSQTREGWVDADAAETLIRTEDRALIEHLFPGTDPETGKLLPGVAIEDVRWVDRRKVGGMNILPKLPDTAMRRAGALIQEPIRAAILFARAAYALNIPANAFMLAFEQGPWTGFNLIRGMFSEHIYGADIARKLDGMAGEGRNLSYVNLDLKWAPLKGSQALASLWNRLADGWMRRAAVIHEIQRLGYKGEEGFREFFGNKNLGKERLEAGARGKKAMIDFSNLSEFEKQNVRNIFFIYPFRSRGLVWDIRTIFEHPAKADIIAHIGSAGAEDLAKDIAKRVPDQLQNAVTKWLAKTGFFPISWDEQGNPTVINASSINNWSLLHDTVYFWDTPNAILQDLGPSAKLATFMVTGRDEYGNELPGPRIIDAFSKIVRDLPQFRAWVRGGKAALQKPLPALDKSSREAMVSRRRKAIQQTVLGPGWMNGWGTLITGGITPREVNANAIFARFWRDLPMKERHKIEMSFLKDALHVQGEFLKRPVPSDVTEAVDFMGRYGRLLKERQHDTQQDKLSPREQTDILLRMLASEHMIDGKELKAYSKRSGELQLDTEHTSFRTALLNRYASRKELANWDDEVRQVWSFRKSVLQRKLDLLSKEGVVPKQTLTQSQDALFAAGREYTKFSHEMTQRKKLIDAELDPPVKKRLEAELRLWLEEHDKSKNGLPSFARIAWANEDAPARAKHIRTIAFGAWQELTTFDKELLGKKRPYGKAWALYIKTIADYKTTQPFDQRNLAPDQRLDLAKQVNAHYPGFIKEWDFAHRRRFGRLRELKVITDSPNKKDWFWILDQAKAFGHAIDNKTLTESDAKAQWHDFIKLNALPWIATDRPNFEKELKAYGLKRLFGLLEQGRP